MEAEKKRTENRRKQKIKKDCTAVKVILKYQLPKKYCNQSVKKKKKNPMEIMF